MTNLQRFFAYAMERELIRKHRVRADLTGRREVGGMPIPWTDDPILQQYRFCNVYREDDKTTAWFRRHIRDPLRKSPSVIFATICFRWFNKIETAEVMLKHNLFQEWDPIKALAYLNDLKPLITGAYMIKTPGGMNKLCGLVEVLNVVWDDREQLILDIDRASTLQEAHQHFMRYPYLGSFMSYEVVTDLRHTWMLEESTDINTWAAAGPGAARGLGRIFHGDVKHYNYNSVKHQLLMMEEMKDLLHASRTEWPPSWPMWEMREVEHTLCEFDKYERARLGHGRPKQLFRGG